MMESESRQGAGPRAGAACPVCGKPATQDHRPFCGRRCADIDLGRWLTGQYVVPGPPLEEPDGAQDGGADAGHGAGG